MKAWCKVVAIIIVVGCGRHGIGTKPPAVTDATNDTDGSSGELGDFADTGGSANDSGDSGNDAGDAALVGQCASLITFQIGAAPGVDPATFCRIGCDGVPAVLTSGPTQLAGGLLLTQQNQVVWTTSGGMGGCATLCDGCDSWVLVCPPCPHFTNFPPQGLTHMWDGSYFATGGTCNGEPCMGPQLCAPKGHYMAEFCVTLGTTAGDSCVALQDSACGTAEFDLPSIATVAVSLSP
jgi:hypothetical protein